ncbi:hypothetical protein [Klebsiella pneumoniae]|uniref:hypothetical protein n=1 Tax=Klebsiella pneumoniae TaxID=573 RepID=UPI0022CDE57C|nr:hypothetical protein [Klebsiella pneumoniae]
MKTATSTATKLVAAIGVENPVIVSTKDAVLVMNRERSRDVKKAVEFLKQNQRSEYKRHREIYRPRGRSDVVVQTRASTSTALP